MTLKRSRLLPVEKAVAKRGTGTARQSGRSVSSGSVKLNRHENLSLVKGIQLSAAFCSVLPLGLYHYQQHLEFADCLHCMRFVRRHNNGVSGL